MIVSILMGYPFFLSSLPEVRVGVEPTWTTARFLDEAGRNLSASDLGVLVALAEGRECGHAFVRGWRDFETQLRNAVVRIRAQRRGVDAKEFLREHWAMDGALDRRVQTIFQTATDPLLRERALNGLRLERLSDLPGDPFSLDAVLAYYLRLRIAEQDAALDADAGRARLRAMASSLPLGVGLESAESSEF